MGEKIEAGQTLSLRLPVDTPQTVLDKLNAVKELEGKHFSKSLYELVIQGLEVGEEDTITLPLPSGIQADQRMWLSHPHTRSLLSGWLEQILKQPSEWVVPVKTQKIEEIAKPEDTPIKQPSKTNGFAVHNSYLKNLSSDLLNQ